MKCPNDIFFEVQCKSPDLNFADVVIAYHAVNFVSIHVELLDYLFYCEVQVAIGGQHVIR